MEHRLLTEHLTGHDPTNFRSWELRQFSRNYSTGKLIEQVLLNREEKVKSNIHSKKHAINKFTFINLQLY